MQLIVFVLAGLGIGWLVDSRRHADAPPSLSVAGEVRQAAPPRPPTIPAPLRAQSDWDKRCAARIDEARRQLHAGSDDAERAMLGRRVMDIGAGGMQGVAFSLEQSVFVAGVTARRTRATLRTEWFDLDEVPRPGVVALVKHEHGRTGIIETNDADPVHRERLVTLFRSALDDCLRMPD